MSSSPSPAYSETIIQPRTGWIAINWRELWLATAGFSSFLVWRDIKVRYKQTVLGVGWGMLQPVMTMVIFSAIFGRLASIPSRRFSRTLFSSSRPLRALDLFCSADVWDCEREPGQPARRCSARSTSRGCTSRPAALGGFLVDFADRVRDRARLWRSIGLAPGLGFARGCPRW